MFQIGEYAAAALVTHQPGDVVQWPGAVVFDHAGQLPGDGQLVAVFHRDQPVQPVEAGRLPGLAVTGERRTRLAAARHTAEDVHHLTDRGVWRQMVTC